MTFILSLNMRGLGAAPKFLALKDLFSPIHPYIILLQETMHVAPQVIECFQNILLDWHMATTNALSLLGVLITIWDPRWVKV